MKCMLFAATAIFAVTAITPAANAQNIRERQWRQQERIERGYQNGDITGKEYRKLTKQQRKIARQARHDRRDGYGLSRNERARIAARQDEASRDIRRQRRDNDYDY
ncbi:hypothetical protein KFK14_13875 [Sphingobium phenoxybenzoativorans]|uniref:Uncharacterized protein n=1 Tax=Sphingobium phenoxybenzoativorans TaxID=1592790 RepID=A0A975K4H1_9SPHN|nr:hypothetical protein [Sphingobium phenoxybenzoativorans]QUT04219.1 hypothetical protein KFK14_13875 [Sphingobium phenoxybenzoativorans]